MSNATATFAHQPANFALGLAIGTTVECLTGATDGESPAASLVGLAAQLSLTTMALIAVLRVAPVLGRDVFSGGFLMLPAIVFQPSLGTRTVLLRDTVLARVRERLDRV